MRRPLLLPVLALLLLPAAASARDLVIGPLPADAPDGFERFFTRHVGVLGTHVYATADTPRDRLLHAATVLAEYLDNDEDGKVDDGRVHQALRSRHASLVMWPTEAAYERSGFDDAIPDRVLDATSVQLLFGAETNPAYPANGVFDWALEEALHLVTFGGWARAHPDAFAEEPGSDLARAMDLNIAAGYFHYDDPTCDYECLVSEYFYWALTSMLGAQNYPWRIAEITDEWELYSQTLVRRHDPAFTALFDDPRWALPRRLPDGAYGPSATGGGGEGEGGGGAGGGVSTVCGETACFEDDETLCLAAGRFAGRATYVDPASGTRKQAEAVSLTADTGYFYFFDRDNVEAVVKVLDACGLNQRFWVFAGGLTDLAVEITVCDTQEGVETTYANPAGTAFRTVNDTSAFATCP